MNKDYQISKVGRVAAFILALITLAGLLIRFVLASEQYGSFLSGASHLYQFFTIITNTLILIVMSMIVVGKAVSRVVVQASVVSIIGVGLIFHVLLSQAGAKHGIAELANQITHTAVPILSFLWWALYADVKSTQWRDSFFSLLWPGAYTVYALARAEFSGFYPYDFIDLSKLGWGGLAQSVFILGLVFLVLALLTIGVGRTVSLVRNT